MLLLLAWDKLPDQLASADPENDENSIDFRWSDAQWEDEEPLLRLPWLRSAEASWSGSLSQASNRSIVWSLRIAPKEN